VKLFDQIVSKIEDPCWLVALAVVALAMFAIKKAHENGKEEGERAVSMLRVALGKEDD